MILLNVTDKKRDVVIHVAGMSRLEVLGALEFAKDAVLSGQ